MTRSEGRKLRKWFIGQYPNMASRTLARKMSEELPELGITLEQARNSVRYYRGESGDTRKQMVMGSGNQIPVTKYESAQAAKSEFKPYILPAVGNGLLIGDIHFPYHDKPALDTAINYAIQHNATEHIIILGDLLDFYQCSRFTRDPRKFSIETELAMARKFLHDMAGIFSKVIFKAGNHEKRFQDYVFNNAPALVGLDGLDLIKMLDLESYGIDYVSWNNPIYAGDHLTLIHGHEYGTRMFSPVNAARGLFMRALSCSVTAHGHRTSQHSEPNIRGTDLSTWSIGCLCDLHPEYAHLNKWNHGFAMLEFNGGDNWNISNHRIIKGHVR